MRRIFVLTGAGISAESGLKTFRDSGGLWEGHRVEEVATPEAYAHDPGLVQDFYNQRRAQLVTVAPNAAHLALAELGVRFGGGLTLVTQNVDDLHERAGSSDVCHMHGELLKKRCEACGVVAVCNEPLSVSSVCPDCEKEGALRPHIVWFGEIPLLMDEIYESVALSDVFIAIGTSGLVYPAAGLAAEAKRYGAKTIEVNLTDTELSANFDELIQGRASEVVPGLVRSLCGF